MNAENLQSLYSKKNVRAIETFQTWMPDTFRQTSPQHGAPLLPLSGGNHITSLSGKGWPLFDSNKTGWREFECATKNIQLI